MARQISGLNPLLLSNIKTTDERKVKFFLCNNRKTAVKSTISQNVFVSKPLLENFKSTDHKHRF